MSIVNFSVKNSPLVNMIMIIVFIVGIYTLSTIPKEDMPAVDFGSFIIIVYYPGVSPEEIEELIVKKIEDEISDVPNVDVITSTAQEGRAVIFIQFEPDADIDKARTDLTTELDKVVDLPEDAEDPYVLALNMREINPMCDIVLGGDFSGNALREIAEDLRDGILNLAYVSKVDITGSRDREIWIEGDANKLAEFGLTLQDLKNTISNRNMNVPGGSVNFGKAEFIVRSIGEFSSTNEIEELVVRMDQNGRALRIRDVAAVKDTLEERSTIAKLDGKKSIRLQAYKKADGNIISVMEDIREYVEDFQKNISGLEITIRNDESLEVKSSLKTMGKSALIGVLLVFVILFIFIGWRNALFAAWGIPFSFLLTFILMQYFDVTMNNLTLFALVLVLGMIVDDAIIVLENVHRYMEQGMSPREASIKGTQEIMWPIIGAISTTAAAFLPMLMMEGMMGKFMRVFPIVVSMALFASLFESLVILPSHIADLSKPIQPDKKKSRLYEFLVTRYRKTIKKFLKHRILSVLGIVLALILAIMTIGLRLVKVEFFHRQESQTVVLKLQTPVGTNLDKTNEVVTSIENFIMNMEQNSNVEAIVTSVGYLVENNQRSMMTSNAQMSIDLVDADKMTFSHDEIKDEVREFLDNLPGLYSYKFAIPQDGPPTGKDVEIRIKGEKLERLEYIGEIVKSELEKIPGVVDIEDSFKEGKKEVKIYPKHNKLALYGLNVAQLARVVRTASYGLKVSEYRGDGVDEYDIIVRLKEEQIKNLEDLKNLRIRSQRGDLIKLKELADFEITSGLSQIDHYGSKRVITITGTNSYYKVGEKNKKRTTDEVTRILLGNKLTGEKGILVDFEKRFQGYRMEFGGVAEERNKSFNSLYIAFGIAILIIFAILSTIFKSYVQPLIVMFTIPFALIGVIFGLFVTGLPFSLGTLVAVVALAGVVVNDSLVLVDFINKEREKGIDRWNSLINAGAIRLRPIILTTVTTIGGLMPMMLSTAKSVKDWKPIAVSMSFGLAFATMLTLFVIPVIYSIVDSLFGRLKLTRFKSHQSYEECVVED